MFSSHQYTPQDITCFVLFPYLCMSVSKTPRRPKAVHTKLPSGFQCFFNCKLKLMLIFTKNNDLSHIYGAN